jgi:hypothetical protein
VIKDTNHPPLCSLPSSNWPWIEASGEHTFCAQSLDMANRRSIPHLVAEATKELAASFQRHSTSF